jgi:preprotein translocase subunit SecD
VIERRRRTELLRKSVAMVALIGSVAVIVAIIGNVWMQIIGGEPQDSTPAQDTPRTSGSVAAANIKPLPVRPVQEVRTPDQCPPSQGPPPLLAPSDVVTVCDMTRTAAYVLGPQAVELQLTGVDSVKSPASEFYVVRVTIQPASAAAFADVTASHVGQQLAFVRDGIVVSAPQITAPVDSEALELSGNLTVQQAEDMARLLRQPP